MPRFLMKKLPPHWLFVPSKRRLKELLVGLGADVRLVEFYGTGYGTRADWLSLGFLESRVIEGGWCFYLHLNGSREAIVGPVRKELEAVALGEIERYIRECLGQQPAENMKPAQLHLWFRIEAGIIRSRCNVTPCGKLTFHSTPARWHGEPTS